jgi:trigger factor
VTLQVHTEENDQRELIMTVEVAEERVERAMRQKARELAREVRIPGFRPGKAPYHVILRRVGQESLRAEAIEDMVSGLFEEAVAESGVDQEELYARPSLDDLTDDPLVLKFTLPLKPMVTFGDYRALRREIEPVVISEEAVDQALEAIQSRYAETEAVDRPAELGDLVTISGVGKLLPSETAAVETEEDGAETAVAEEETIFDQEQTNVLMDPQKAFPGTPFVDNLLGLSAGEDVTFIFTFPDDYDEADLVGREARFEISVLNVQRRDLPPLDDDLALKERAGTLDELREKVRRELNEEAEETAKNELLEYMIEEMRKEATLAYPPAAVEEEVEGMLEDYQQQVTRSGWSWEDFLTIQGQTEETVRENFRETAVTRVENRTIFSNLMTQEKITVVPEDLDTAVEARLAKFEDERLREGMREYLLQGEGIQNIAAEILTNKLYARIKAILSGTAPDLAELEAATTALDEEE